MAQRNDDVLFKQHQKVVAAHDLPGIDAGTRGKILLINGLSWVRYRVLFETGVERGMLNPSDLTTTADWAAQQLAAANAAREAERAARRAANGAAAPEGS